MKHFIFTLLFLSSMAISAQKEYVKEFYPNGNLKQEGWVLKDKKINHWKFYYENGNLKKQGNFVGNLETKYWYFYRPNLVKEKEGFYQSGKKTKWWLFYNSKGQIHYKCQLENNKKNGYCLVYQNTKLIKASKYEEGKKIKEWRDFYSFKRENNLSDLR